MLCSVPDSKSGPNWLDRLRSNKGFPTGDNLDLDHFLSRSPNSSSEFPTADASSTESTRPHVDRVANRSGSSYPAGDNQGKALVGLMTNVLSELFFMGGSDESSKLFGKKIPRKQKKPRVCVISTTNSNSNTSAANTTAEKSSGCERNDPNILDETASLNLDSSLMENKNEGNVGGGEGEEEEEEEEEEKGERELKGYSRSEVTVIDTSCGVWKTEKVVFRRKSVWKVREKKSRLRTFGRNKRKVVHDEEVVAEDGHIDNKKAKVSASGEECIALKSNQGQNSQNDTRKEVCEDTPDDMNERREEFSKDMPDNNSKDIKKGFPFNRSPRKMRKGGSSVILIKGITTDKKNGAKLPKKTAKSNTRLD